MAGDRLPPNRNRITEDNEGFFEDVPEDEVMYSESDARIAEWIESNRVENYQPYLTIYKFRQETGTEKEQCDSFREEIPTRHDIGLLYGGGRYQVIMSNGAYDKKLRKTTSFCFRLHSSYDLRSREYHAEKLKQAVVPASAGASGPDPRQSFSETLALVQSIQNQTLSMFRPLIERALQPPLALPAPANNNPLQETLANAAMFKQLVKANMEDTVNIMNDLTRKTLELNQRSTEIDEEEDELPPEKKSMFEKILELAEPLLPLLIKNTMAAKATAAGIRAIPQFKEVIKDNDLVKRVIHYVDAKESPEKADIALRNLGINRKNYMREVHSETRTLPHKVKILPVKPKGSGVFKPKVITALKAPTLPAQTSTNAVRTA